MKYVDMRMLPAAAQEERRRQVIGRRQAGMTYDAIAAQVGLTRTGTFNICRRFAERGAAGLKSGPRGPAPGTGRHLGAAQEAAVRERVCHKRAGLSLLSAVANKGALRWMVVEGAVKAPDLVRFLRRLVREAAGRKVFLILDRLKVHRARLTRDWLP